MPDVKCEGRGAGEMLIGSLGRSDGCEVEIRFSEDVAMMVLSLKTCSRLEIELICFAGLLCDSALLSARSKIGAKGVRVEIGIFADVRVSGIDLASEMRCLGVQWIAWYSLPWYAKVAGFTILESGLQLLADGSELIGSCSLLGALSMSVLVRCDAREFTDGSEWFADRADWIGVAEISH